jgi:hypothetical protein
LRVVSSYGQAKPRPLLFSGLRFTRVTQRYVVCRQGDLKVLFADAIEHMGEPFIGLQSRRTQSQPRPAGFSVEFDPQKTHGGVADEAGYKSRFRVRANIVRGSNLLDNPVAHNHYEIG